jgi:hypothetical protein
VSAFEHPADLVRVKRRSTVGAICHAPLIGRGTALLKPLQSWDLAVGSWGLEPWKLGVGDCELTMKRPCPDGNGRFGSARS